MSKSSLETALIKRARKLTTALIISGTLNTGLLAAFFYSALQERKNFVTIEMKPSAKESLVPSVSKEKLLQSYSELSFQELLLNLQDKSLVEDGYTKRDLALSCLVSFHHFNLERALGGLQLQKRLIPFGNVQGAEQIPLLIFPGLADYQYQAILQYARTEKWPLTAQGLFFEIQRGRFPQEPTLLEAFYLTPQFHTAYLLLIRTGVKIEKELLVQMLAQGSWSTLDEMTKQQRLAQDFSLETRRAFLLNYLDQRSAIAAKLFLHFDFEFSCRRISDTETLILLDLLSSSDSQLTAFAKELIVCPRSDAIWRKCATLLYGGIGEQPSEPYDHLVTLKRFAPHFLPASLPETPIVQAPAPFQAAPTPAKRRTHKIAAGDNLWKIARKYRVSVESLKRHNRLESDRLRPGKELEIPDRD